MNYQQALKDNEISKFEDVSKFLEANNIKVKQDTSVPELYLVYFDRVDRTYDELSPLQRECNGAIYEKNTNKLVCACFDKFNKDSVNPEEMFSLDDEDLNIECSINGTLIRVYYYAGKWYFATKKCINADHAYWASRKSFGTMFQECLNEKPQFDFDPQYTYFFIMHHPENQNIFPITKMELFHISTYQLETNKFLVQYIGFYKPKVISVRDKPTLDILINKKTIDAEGYILYRTNTMGRIHQKIIFPSYKERCELYGNTKSRFFRFLEIQNNIETVKNYLEKFPYHKDLFYGFEQQLISFCKNLHEAYLSIRVKRIENYKYDKRLGKCLYNLHGQYLKTRNPITLKSVMNYVKPLDAKLLMYLIR